MERQETLNSKTLKKLPSVVLSPGVGHKYGERMQTQVWKVYKYDLRRLRVCRRSRERRQTSCAREAECCSIGTNHKGQLTV